MKILGKIVGIFKRKSKKAGKVAGIPQDQKTDEVVKDTVDGAKKD